MPGSFFELTGYSSSTQSTLDTLVATAIAAAGAIGPKSVTVVNPLGTEDLILFYVNAAVTVAQITCSVRGTTPSMNVKVAYSATPDGATTQLVTAGITVTDATVTTAFDVSSIPLNSYVRLILSSMAGTVTELAVSIDF